MFDTGKITETTEYIKENFPKDAREIIDVLDLLNLALDGVLDSANIQISELHKAKEYSKSKELIDFSEQLSNVQSTLSEYSALLIDPDQDSEEDDELDLDIDKKGLPDYAAYAIDDKIPHSLYENFTYTKATAFSFKGTRYEVKNMQDVLLQTCNLLAGIDIQKIKSFVNDPTMKGRVVSYFGIEAVKTESGYKNVKIPNTDIYVWTNLSSNLIRNLIRKLLKKYDISFSDFQIFLRADYTALHPSTSIDNVPPQGAEKIGKHVYKTMKFLSDRNYQFSDDEILAMQSEKWSKDELGIYQPLLVKCREKIEVSEQISVKLYPRYWKDIFAFNSQKFFVSSQWYEKNRIAFDKWFNGLRM